jgi:hypothetical protein
MHAETLADLWVGIGGGIIGSGIGFISGIGSGDEPDIAARTSFALTQFSTARISDGGEVDAATRTSDPDVA